MSKNKYSRSTINDYKSTDLEELKEQIEKLIASSHNGKCSHGAVYIKPQEFKQNLLALTLNYGREQVEQAEAQLAALFINAAGGRVVLSRKVMTETTLNPSIHSEIMPDGSVEYWLDEEALKEKEQA